MLLAVLFLYYFIYWLSEELANISNNISAIYLRMLP